MSNSNIHSTVNFTSSSSSSSATTSPSLPSVFELLAQERLTDLIHPCLSQILKFMHESQPWSKTLRALYKYKDELILFIESVVQWLHLQFYSALVGERFYGLRRTADHRLRALILSVFLPYVKRKLDQLYERMRADNENQRTNFYMILKILPKVQMFLEGVCWLYRISYAFGRTEYYSPELQLAGTKLVYAKEPVITPPPSTTAGRFFAGISKVMSSGLFLIQFVDWWNSANGSKPVSANITVQPPLPNQIQARENIGKRQCPLCRQPCNVPTAVIGSGFVYCNQCISTYITRYRRCPTTHQPLSLDQLVKIY